MKSPHGHIFPLFSHSSFSANPVNSTCKIIPNQLLLTSLVTLTLTLNCRDSLLTGLTGFTLAALWFWHSSQSYPSKTGELVSPLVKSFNSFRANSKILFSTYYAWYVQTLSTSLSSSSLSSLSLSIATVTHVPQTCPPCSHLGDLPSGSFLPHVYNSILYVFCGSNGSPSEKLLLTPPHEAAYLIIASCPFILFYSFSW